MVSFGIVAVVAAIVILATLFFAGRGAALVLGLGALLVAGGAFFLLGTRAAPPPPPAPPMATAPVAAPPTPPPALPPATGWTAKGRVHDAQANPVAGARVQVFDISAFVEAASKQGPLLPPAEVEEAMEMVEGIIGKIEDPMAFVPSMVTPAVLGEPVASGVAGADGTFSIAGCPAGGALFRATKTGFVPAVAPGAAGEGEIDLLLVPGASVAGRVLDAEDGSPIPGALVSSGKAALALAGPEGEFRLEGVPFGKSKIAARAPLHLRATVDVDAPAEGLSGIEIRLQAGAGLAGAVRDERGNPVAGATIEIKSLVTAPMVGEVETPSGVEEVRSGKDGSWTCLEVPAGKKLRVAARTADRLGDSVDVEPVAKATVKEGVDLELRQGGAVVATVVDAKGAPVKGARVSVEPSDGKEDDGDVRGVIRQRIRQATAAAASTDEAGRARVGPVPPGPVKVKVTRNDFREAEQSAAAVAGEETALSFVLDPGLALRGRVVDAAGAPVADAHVQASRFQAGGNMDMQGRQTAADGTFVIGGLAGKGFRVEASKQGFVTAKQSQVDPAGEPLTLTLVPGGTIFGKIADAAGNPVTKFRVTKKRSDGGGSRGGFEAMGEMFMEMAGQPAEAADGSYRLEGLEPGTYAVEAKAKDLAPGRAEGVVVVGGRETEANLVCPEGLALRGIVVRKGDGAPVAGAKVRIPGEGLFGQMDFGMDEMLEPTAEADGGATVDVQAQVGDAMGGMFRASAVTDAEGRFALLGLEKGTVRLLAAARGLAPARSSVEIPSAQEVRIELPQESAIEGTVLDAKGAPKAGAMVMIQQGIAFMRMGATGDDGHYRIGGVPAGSYLFMVMEGAGMMGGGGGMNLRSSSVTLEEGKTTRKDYRLGEGTKVTGRVTRGGKPAPGMMVMLTPSSSKNPMAAMFGGGGGGGFCMGTTTDDGTYEITGVTPGRYTLSVGDGPGGGIGGGDALEIPRGATEVKKDVVLPETGIRGIVVDEDGKPVEGAVVHATEAGKDMTRMSDLGSAMEAMGGQTQTDDDGRFDMAGMRAGTFTVTAQADGFGAESVDGVASSENGPEIRIVLHKGVAVTVRVLGPKGDAVPGAAVFLVDAEGKERTNIRMNDAPRTGPDGRVEIQSPAGSVRIEVTAEGYGPGETTASVPGAEVTVRLPRGSVLKVTVTDADGNPAGGASVELLDAAGKTYARRFSFDALADLMQGGVAGSDGTRTWKDLPAGTWTVRAHRGEGRAAEETVTIPEGETKAVTLRVP